MTGPKMGRPPRCVDELGELCVLQDFCIVGADKDSAGDLFSDTRVFPGGVRAGVWPFATRPGEELEGSTGCEGVLQTGVDKARELLGELEWGTSCVLGSENETCTPSPERCRCTGVKELVVGCCTRPLSCISSASARITFISTLQPSSIRIRAF